MLCSDGSMFLNLLYKDILHFQFPEKPAHKKVNFLCKSELEPAVNLCHCVLVQQEREHGSCGNADTVRTLIGARMHCNDGFLVSVPETFIYLFLNVSLC